MLFAAVHESGCGTFRTSHDVRYPDAIGGLTDIHRKHLNRRS